jgi:hypothetical protein
MTMLRHIHTICAISGILLSACHSRLTYPPGGYPYPKNPTAKDTQLYRYPLKDVESRRDSISDASTYTDWRYTGEPNLSLGPMPTDVFRFTYDQALDPTTYIIRMTPREMTIRIGTPTEAFPYLPDTSLLNPLERRLIGLLERNYPIDDTSLHHSQARRHYLDSMGRLYPQLYDPAYYIALRNREFPHVKPWFNFTSRTLLLKPGDFEHLVSLINRSGYWQLPYEMPCPERPFDGWGYSLEANTAHQYNYVEAGSCIPDTSNFTKACQALVNFAGLERKIHLLQNPSIEVDTTTSQIPPH